MTIDISEIDYALNRCNHDPIHVSLRFERNYMFVYVEIEHLMCSKTVSFSLNDVRAMKITLEELVNSVVENFINEVRRAFDYFFDKRSDSVTFKPELAGYDVPKNKPKARWIDFGDFTNGKGFYCSNCGHRMYVLDGAYPSDKKCTNCKREME